MASFSYTITVFNLRMTTTYLAVHSPSISCISVVFCLYRLRHPRHAFVRYLLPSHLSAFVFVYSM